jgi:hypothetical protein
MVESDWMKALAKELTPLVEKISEEVVAGFFSRRDSAAQDKDEAVNAAAVRLAGRLNLKLESEGNSPESAGPEKGRKWRKFCRGVKKAVKFLAPLAAAVAAKGGANDPTDSELVALLGLARWAGLTPEYEDGGCHVNKKKLLEQLAPVLQDINIVSTAIDEED